MSDFDNNKDLIIQNLICQHALQNNGKTDAEFLVVGYKKQ